MYNYDVEEVKNYLKSEGPETLKVTNVGLCIALQPTRAKLQKFTHKYCSENPMITSLVTKFCDQSSPDFCQFILNCSAISKVQVFTS